MLDKRITSLEPYVTERKYMEIVRVIEENPDIEFLKPLKEALPKSYSYSEIKWAINWKIANNNAYF